MVLAVQAETRQTLCLHPFHALTFWADEIPSAVPVQDRKAPLSPRGLAGIAEDPFEVHTRLGKNVTASKVLFDDNREYL